MSKFKVVLTDNIFPDLIMEREMLAKIDAELIEVTESANVGPECEDADAVIDTYEQIPAEMIEKMQQVQDHHPQRHWRQHDRRGCVPQRRALWSPTCRRTAWTKWPRTR